MMLGTIHGPNYSIGFSGLGAASPPPPVYPLPLSPSAVYESWPNVEYQLQRFLNQRTSSLTYDYPALDISTLDIDGAVNELEQQATDACDTMQQNAVKFGSKVDPVCLPSVAPLAQQYGSIFRQWLSARLAWQQANTRIVNGIPTLFTPEQVNGIPLTPCNGGSGDPFGAGGSGDWVQHCKGGANTVQYAPVVSNILNSVAPQSGQMYLAPSTNALNPPTGFAPVNQYNQVQTMGPSYALTQGAGADVAQQTGAAPPSSSSPPWMWIGIAAVAALFLLGGNK